MWEELLEVHGPCPLCGFSGEDGRLHAFEQCVALEDLVPTAWAEPSEEALNYVGSVWERRKWCGERLAVEDVATPLRQQVVAPVPAPTAEPKVLHLVLQPAKRRPYEDSALGLFKETILDSVKRHRVTIIVAPTGCGKSTGVPQMLLDQDASNQVLVTQPRRVAATSLARRVSEQRGVLVGEEVGFKIGGGGADPPREL